MSQSIRKTIATIAALAALALGGAALADAASSGSSGSGAASGSPAAPPGRHVGANGQVERALGADVAAAVETAAQRKVRGGTVERVETDVDHGSPYEAHVRKADGTELEVLVNKSYEVTAVNTMPRMGGPGGPPNAPGASGAAPPQLLQQ